MSSSSARHPVVPSAPASPRAGLPVGSRAGLLVGLLTGVLLAGHLGVPGRTSATFTSTASTAGVVTTTPACVGDLAGYTSGLLDDAAPLLRWSFSAATAGTAGPVGPAGSATTGLLVCDPADLAAGGDAGPTAPRSLDLTGAVGGGVTSAPVAPSGPMSLLLWVQPGAGDGELASLSVATSGAAPGDGTDHAGGPKASGPIGTVDPTGPIDPAGTDGAIGPADAGTSAAVPARAPDALVLGLAGDTVHLTEVRGGTPTVLTGVPITHGRTHLLAAVVTVTADGVPHATLAVDDGPATDPVPLATAPTGASLTVGARPSATAASARVDEVTLLAREVEATTRVALLAADRWWSPAGAAPAPPA